MALSKLAVLAGVAGASVISRLSSSGDRLGHQLSLTGAGGETAEGFACDLPPVLDPAGDGLLSADELFSGDVALARQVERHQAIVRVPSVSYDDLGPPGEDERWAPFYDLHETLEVLYPNIHRRATRDKVNTLGLVYTIQGSDASLKPTLLAAHQDVVPVADESTWTHPPFAAVYDGEWLWGRGASDDKNSLTALLSAVDALLNEEDHVWQPRRTLVLAFGFDEECSGYRGAGAIGEFLTERYGDDGIAVILDEGGLGMMPVGEDALYALPAVMEKGHVDIYFELSVKGGHSSIPFPHTAIGIVAEIVSALEAQPYEPELLRDSPVHRHMQCQARYSPYAVPELTDLVRKGDLEGTAAFLAEMNAAAQYMIQTSQSVDLIQGGQKINAMPEHVSLGVNYRVAPQDSIPQIQHNVLEYIRGVVTKYGLNVTAFEDDEEYEAYAAQLAPSDRMGGTTMRSPSRKAGSVPSTPCNRP
jgi:Gly-Xaa carboxypeptidase